MIARGRLLSVFFGLAVFGSLTPTAWPQSFDIGILDPSLLGAAIPQNVADESIRMVGNYAAHRPFQGATPISRYNTLDLNLEVSLVKIGPGLIRALQSANATSLTSTDYRSIPLFKINARKSLNERTDLGVSGISYAGQLVVGGDIRFLLVDAEEGPALGLRIGYNYINLPAVAYVRSHNTIQPELVVSRPLDFAEPYLGLGARYMWGTLTFPLDSPIPATITKKGTAFDAYAFTGVYFHLIGPQGLRMGIEGSYHGSGYHTLGTCFGIGF